MNSFIRLEQHGYIYNFYFQCHCYNIYNPNIRKTIIKFSIDLGLSADDIMNKVKEFNKRDDK